MMRRRGALAAAVIVVAGVAVWRREDVMGLFGTSDRSRLAELLGPGAERLLDGASIVGWSADADHVPLSYFVIRPCTAAELPQIAAALGASFAPAPKIAAGALGLPPGAEVPGWSAVQPPAADAQDASLRLGSANLSLRWQGGQLYATAHRLD